jgi:hypothetical protein
MPGTGRGAATNTWLFGAKGRTVDASHQAAPLTRETDMAKGEQKGNRESKKPKKEKIKTIAAAPSQKTAGWQPSFGSGKKK